MEAENKNITKNLEEGIESKKITRKEAIKKSGYAALSAATMMVLLSNKANATQPHTSPKVNNGNHYGNQTPDQNPNDNKNQYNGGNNNQSNNNNGPWGD
ncbi:hypothetical protein ACUNWD_08695 [Sunxiuqinia sp. A32]|uniref:hypothetical protein n=1 Tax=Sunxiuqinia sp. A32 TaxID=3461496 RepID=UPI004045C6FE